MAIPSSMPGTDSITVRRFTASRRQLITALLALVGAALVGVVVGAGGKSDVIALICVAVVFTLTLASWKRSLRWMLFYMPFSGLLPLILYPSSGGATQLKDIAFILPAYIASAWILVKQRSAFSVPKAPWLLVGMFTLLVAVESFNPAIARPLVAPIGIKGWLWYIPLLPLGYHMFSDRIELRRVLKWLAILGLIPNVLGLIEAALVYGGQSGFVYHLYGAAAAATTENFTTFNLGGGSLTRISSIFTFVAQYWFFSTAMIAVSWAAWRGNRDDPLMKKLGPVMVTIALFAGLTSGLRAAFIFDPGMLVLIAALDGFSFTRVVVNAIGVVVAVAITLLLLGIPVGPLASLTSGHTSFIVSFFGNGFSYAFRHSVLGLGTGVDTNQARYAFGNSPNYSLVYGTVGGVWWESTYLQAFLELGIAGIVVWVALMLAILKRCLNSHFAIAHDPESRGISAAITGLLVWSMVFAFKTTVIGDDPMDVYMWLFVGWQWRLGDDAVVPVRATARRVGQAVRAPARQTSRQHSRA